MFGEWNGLIIVFGIIFLFIYGIILLCKRLNKHIGNTPWKIQCQHLDEPNHDRMACYQRQGMGAGMFFIFLAILPKH